MIIVEYYTEIIVPSLIRSKYVKGVLINYYTHHQIRTSFRRGGFIVKSDFVLANFGAFVYILLYIEL